MNSLRNEDMNINVFEGIEFPYMSYIMPAQTGFDNVVQDEDVPVRLGEQERQNYVFLDDFFGNKVKVKTHSPGK